MPVTNIIRKISTSVGFGYMITDEKAIEQDYNNCSSKISSKTMSFELRTADGRYVPLGNTNFSFSILFALK
jgi:hypothetical protein